jgi:hypothetical protein
LVQRSQHLIVERRIALSSSPSTVKPFEPRRTTRHCHHPPGSKNSPSEGYAEIGTDSFRTRSANVVREFAPMFFCTPNHPPACPAWGGVELARCPVVANRRQCFTLELTTEVASSRRNSPSYCIICRINCSTIRPRRTLQRSEARSRGSVASTVGRVQRFKDSIAQARQPCEPSYP